jgi:hypothetical protein
MREAFPGDDLVVLDVFVKQDAGKVRAFAAKHPFPFLVLRDAGGASRELLDYRITPLVVIVDRRGILRFRGGVTKAEELRPILEACLAEALPAPAGGAPSEPQSGPAAEPAPTGVMGDGATPR